MDEWCNSTSWREFFFPKNNPSQILMLNNSSEAHCCELEKWKKLLGSCNKQEQNRWVHFSMELQSAKFYLLQFSHRSYPHKLSA